MEYQTDEKGHHETTAEDLKRAASKVLDDPKRYWNALEAEIVEFTREQPLKAVVLAALAGYIFAALRDR